MPCRSPNSSAAVTFGRRHELNGSIVMMAETELIDALQTRFFTGFDGTELVYHEMGAGQPIVLIHGYLSDALTNWIRFGHAEAIAAKGFRVIMPDLRGHGESAKPHTPDAYPPDALAMDGHALIEQLELTDYDLGGYSLGARTTVRMLVTGATPRRVILSGMGLEGIIDTARRSAHFRHVLTHLGQHERGSPEWLAESFLKTTKGDAEALLLILDTFVDTPLDVVVSIKQRTLVVCGNEDFDNGSAADLASTLPAGQYFEIPGGHMSSVTKPELEQAIADFVAGDR